ncbi:hypothetical protein Tco_1062380 [Tanacetum coccineum]
MDALSEVFVYLNELESMLDDGESPMKKEDMVKEGTEMERIDAMEIVENVQKKVKHEIVVFTKAPHLENDFIVVNYLNDGEPSIVFRRSFLVTTKSRVDFEIGEMRVDVTMLKEEMDIDTLLIILWRIWTKLEIQVESLLKWERPTASKAIM